MAISASTPAPTSAPPYYRASSNPAGSRHCLAQLLPRHRPQPLVVIQSSTVSNQFISLRPTSASHITTNKLDHGTCTHPHFHTHDKHPHASPRISIHDDNMPSNNPRPTTTTTYTTQCTHSVSRATPGHQWMVSLPALRPSRAGSKLTAHWPPRASFQVSLSPVQQAGRLCLRPSATPLLRTEEGAQQLACLFLLRFGFIILHSAATRAPLTTGSVLGLPGPSPPAGRGSTRPCRRLGPALTTTGQNVTLRSAHDHSCQQLLHSPPSNQSS